LAFLIFIPYLYSSFFVFGMGIGKVSYSGLDIGSMSKDKTQ
jgi:hypothetical protein